MLTNSKQNWLEGIKKFSKVTLVVVLIISAFFGYLVKDIRFDYDFEAFFPIDDPETKFFEEHRHRFESDNDFIFIAIKNEPSVFDKTFLKKVDAFADSIAKDSLVRDVQCLTNMNEYIKTSFSPLPFKRPYINIDEPENYSKDSARIFENNHLVNFFINQKSNTLLIYIKHDQFLAKTKCDELRNRIDLLLVHHEITDFKYAGRAVGLAYYIHKMQYETGLFIGLSFILVIGFLYMSFRSFWGIWVPLTIVALSMIWIVGFMSLVGQPINLILTVLPSIIFVVAMSDVIHLVSKYMDELRTGKDKIDAIKTAYREVGLATLMTSLTTSIGFISLLMVNMAPVKDFGIYTAVGVMLAFVLAYTLLPSLLVLTKKPKIANQSLTENIWYKILHKLFRILVKKRKLVVGISVITFLISIGGTMLIQSNYFLLEDLSKSSSLRQDYDYFDKEFMGLRPFEISVHVKDETKNIYHPEVLAEIEKVTDYLEKDYGLKHCFSIVEILRLANKAEHGGQKSYEVLPDTTDTKKFIKQIETFDQNNSLALLVDSTKKYTRISSTIGDIGRYAIEEKNVAFLKFIEEKINQDLLEIKITGTAHLLDRNMTSLSKNLILGLLLSVGIIGLIMGFLYRSLKMVMIALFVNTLPMLMISAFMGFVGIDLKVSTAIIFTISFGIAVDDTLHFMGRFRQELKKGKSHLYSLKRTFLSTGRAIVLTSLILCAGFLMLMFSDFLGTFYVGLLISLTLFFALLADLLLLPVLLLVFYKKRKDN